MILLEGKLNHLTLINRNPLNCDSDEGDYMSPAAGRKAIERCSNRLPTTPKKWLRVVGGMINRATPRKKKLLHKSMIVVSPKTKCHIETNKGIAKGVKIF
jgi:hypothetical protein